MIDLAIKKINPDAEFTINADDIDQITWLNGTTPIAKEDIEAMIPTVEAEEAQKYIEESGAEGLVARPIEKPSGFKTIDAYAIKLTPEMVLPTKTHLASGGYVRYDPLVSIDEMIGAA